MVSRLLCRMLIGVEGGEGVGVDGAVGSCRGAGVRVYKLPLSESSARSATLTLPRAVASRKAFFASDWLR